MFAPDQDMPDDDPQRWRGSIDAAVADLSRAGVASARVDAELLAAHVLGVPRLRLRLLGPADRFDAERRARFERLVRARAQRIPLQHLIGSAPFRGIELAVGPGVFVPRFETELLVQWGLTRLEGHKPTVVDLCAGSGAIALSVAVEVPRSVVYCVEQAPDALVWLRRNVAAIAPRVRVVQGDVTDPATLSTLDGSVDLVLCNPPYVPEGTPVAPEVSRHDPPGAVFGGVDGLALLPAIVARAMALLRPGGWFGIEHDDTHGDAVPALLTECGLSAVQDHLDLAGRARFATGQRPADVGLADCTS